MTGNTETPDSSKQIREQIEFYFSDVNLQKDKFLIEQIKLDEGWVPMTVMLNFKALAALSEDIPTILKSLEDSELMEISEDKKQIRRSLKFPLPVYDEAYKKAQEERSVYAKGFPQEGMTIQKLKDFMEPYGPVEKIVMRKYKNASGEMLFKGSIFIQFKTLDSAKAFMELENVKYEEKELLRRWSVEYLQEKEKAAKEAKKLKEEKKEKKQDANPAKDDKVEERKPFPKGAILHITGIPESCERMDLKQKLVDLGADIAFFEFIKDSPQAWVRLREEDAAKTLLEKIEDSKLKINDSEALCRVLEGEEEEQYLKKIGASQPRNKNHNRGRGRGKKRNFSQRGGDRNSKSKKAKAE